MYRSTFGVISRLRNEKSIENLARHIIRASFSQERMTYHRETDHVVCRPKDGKETKVFNKRTIWILINN